MANRNLKNKNMKFKNVKVAVKNGGVKKRLGQRSSVGDARQKLIQKKRNTVVDARDILAGKAKTQDARSKLLKMRAKHTDPESRDIRAIGSNILRKTDRNGKISLVTNKHRPSNNMNIKIQQQLGIISSSRSAPTRPVKKVTKRPVKPPFEPPVIKKTIRNEYSPTAVAPYPYEPQDLYRWYPGISPLLGPIEMRRPVMDITVSRGLVSDNTSGDWRTYSSSLKPPNGYIDLDAVIEDEEMPLSSPARPGMARVASNIHSRLDTKPATNSTHGILSQAKTKVVVPVGHRIVVSNLQSTVTQDDIRELFEDIGQLLVARLVRPGTAEVIYKNLKDAQKAVDTYHNRQLDGQPMKCLLVNKRPVNNPTAPAIKSNNEGMMAARKPTSSTTNSNKLIPDISTIHKVLFQRK